MTDRTLAERLSGTGMSDNLDIGKSMPMLRIIQDGSPEVKKSHPLFLERQIKGAEAGELVFTAESTAFESVEALPITQKSLYSEWTSRSSGGKFVAHHDLGVTSNNEYRREGVKEYLGENELAYTMFFASLFLDSNEDKWKECIIAFSKTALGPARLWNKSILRFKYPDDIDISPFMFSQSYLLSTTIDHGSQGDAYFNWSIQPHRTLDFATDAKLLERALASRDIATQSLPQAEAQPLLREANDSATTPF